VGHSAPGKCIVTDNLPPSAEHIGPGGAAFLVLECSAFQPVIERRFATLKLRQIMGCS
jgi:hypothetical protein